MVRVVIYARVAYPNREELNEKVQTLQNYALSKGWEIVGIYKEIKSGLDTSNREILLEAVKKVKELDNCSLLVHSLTDISRKQSFLTQITNELNGKIIMSKIRAIIYARVSTKKQEEQGHSIEAQIKACRAYAEMKGWEVVGVYHEPKSGKNAKKRLQLQRALTFLEEGGADVLIVWRLDRLTRSILDFQQLLEKFGPKFVSVNNNWDMTTATGRFAASMFVLFAQFQREQISENTIRGLEEARAKGKRIGRPPKIPEDIKKKILYLRKRGYTLKEIAEKTGIKYNTVKTICYRAGV